MKILDRFDSLPLPESIKNILFLVAMIFIISTFYYITLGLFTPLPFVGISHGGSMVPTLETGDLVLIQGASRTEITTSEVAELTGYRSFDLPGDIILWHPYGKEDFNLTDFARNISQDKPFPQVKEQPWIHRTLYYVEKGDPMWKGGPPAPFPGYITKGDQANMTDQEQGRILGKVNSTYLTEYKGQIKEIGDSIFLNQLTGQIIYKIDDEYYIGEGISYLTPVKREWIIGVARVRIPYIGFVRLAPNIVMDLSENWKR